MSIMMEYPLDRRSGEVEPYSVYDYLRYAEASCGDAPIEMSYEPPVSLSTAERLVFEGIEQRTHFGALKASASDVDVAIALNDALDELNREQTDPKTRRQHFIREFEKENPEFDYELALYLFEPVNILDESDSRSPQSDSWYFNQLLDDFLQRQQQIDDAYPMHEAEVMPKRLAAKIDTFSNTWVSLASMIEHDEVGMQYLYYTLKIVDTIIASPKDFISMMPFELNTLALWNRGRTITEDKMIQGVMTAVSDKLMCLDIEHGGFYADTNLDPQLTTAIACEGFANARALWERERADAAMTVNAPAAEHLSKLHFHDLEDAKLLFTGINILGQAPAQIQEEVLRFQTVCYEHLRVQFGDSSALWFNYFGLEDPELPGACEL